MQSNKPINSTIIIFDIDSGHEYPVEILDLQQGVNSFITEINSFKREALTTVFIEELWNKYQQESPNFSLWIRGEPVFASNNDIYIANQSDLKKNFEKILKIRRMSLISKLEQNNYGLKQIILGDLNYWLPLFKKCKAGSLLRHYSQPNFETTNEFQGGIPVNSDKIAEYPVEIIKLQKLSDQFLFKLKEVNRKLKKEEAIELWKEYCNKDAYFKAWIRGETVWPSTSLAYQKSYEDLAELFKAVVYTRSKYLTSEMHDENSRLKDLIISNIKYWLPKFKKNSAIATTYKKFINNDQNDSIIISNNENTTATVFATADEISESYDPEFDTITDVPEDVLDQLQATFADQQTKVYQTDDNNLFLADDTVDELFKSYDPEFDDIMDVPEEVLDQLQASFTEQNKVHQTHDNTLFVADEIETSLHQVDSALPRTTQNLNHIIVDPKKIEIYPQEIRDLHQQVNEFLKRLKSINRDKLKTNWVNELCREFAKNPNFFSWLRGESISINSISYAMDKFFLRDVFEFLLHSRKPQLLDRFLSKNERVEKMIDSNPCKWISIMSGARYIALCKHYATKYKNHPDAKLQDIIAVIMQFRERKSQNYQNARNRKRQLQHSEQHATTKKSNITWQPTQFHQLPRDLLPPPGIPSSLNDKTQTAKKPGK